MRTVLLYTCNICTLPQPEQENDQHPSVGSRCASFWYRTPVQAGWQPVTPPMSRHFHRFRWVTHTIHTTPPITRIIILRGRHTYTHTHTDRHTHTDGRTSAHDTTTATTVRIPTDMSRRRWRRQRWRRWRRRLSVVVGRAGGRPVGITSPVAGNRFPDDDDVFGIRCVRARSGPFMSGTRPIECPTCTIAGPYSFSPIIIIYIIIIIMSFMPNSKKQKNFALRFRQFNIVQ